MPVNFPISNEAEWLEFRTSFVGGSEVASLFDQWLVDGHVITTHVYEPVPEGAMFIGGLSSFKSGHKLWLEKKGLLAPDNLDFVERVQAGKHLEAGIAAWAMEKWPDMRLRKVRRYIGHDKVGGWGASLDYETVASPRVPVEIKNVSGISFAQKWVAEEGEIISAPLNYILQVQSQIGAAGASHGWLVACVNGNELYRMRIDRHEPIQQRIGVAIASFWAGVQHDIFPAEHLDREANAKLFAFSEADTIADLTADPQLDNWAARYLRWNEHLKAVSKNVDQLKARIQSKLGAATVGVTDKYNLKWPGIVIEEKIVPEHVQARREYRGGLYISVPKPKKAKKEPKNG